MDNLSAQQKLMGNMQATSAELLSGIMEERGRGFASDREAWAQLKENIENVESRMKAIKDVHKDMWSAVKDHNGDAFCALAGEFQRSAILLAMEWTNASVLANIAVLTVDTDLSFCDIAQCDSIPGGSFCEDGRCDQRRCYEKLREYERSDLEPETLQKAQGLLKELKDARQTVELMDACGKRVCSSEEHWGCPYGNEGMTDCAVLLEAAYEDTIEKLLALKETLEG